MTTEAQLGEWSVRFVAHQQPVVYHRQGGYDLATIHGEGEVAFTRAVLIAKAPSLLRAVRAATSVFGAMAQYGDDHEREVGREMLPSLEAALHGLEEGR